MPASKLTCPIHASEPQDSGATGECITKRHNAYSLPEAFFVWLGDKPLAGPMTERQAKESAEAINTALAAEREKEFQHGSRSVHAAYKWDEANQILGLQQQLADEQQKRADWNVVIENLEQQLLAAQAAVEKHNKTVDDLRLRCDPIDIDATALAAHDAALVKPLVEALEVCRAEINWHNRRHTLLPKIDAALAKVKK
jgi:hypothetical protein